jgi:signal recognition particle subunit SRP54
MLQGLTSKFKDILAKIGKTNRIDEAGLDVLLREVRMVLLEADIPLELTKVILQNLKNDLLGREIYKSITAKDVVTKALYDSFLNILNQNETQSKLHSGGYIMLVGLQGSGKTTTSGKIGYYLKNKENKKILLVGLDLQRKAAYEQLQSLAKANSIDFFEYSDTNLITILNNLKSFVKQNSYDAVLIDTAGRLAIDEALMKEMQFIYNELKPKETLFVMDSLIGQTSFSVASEFAKYVNLSGVVISKADADYKGGSVLSAKFVTQQPIKFMGVGEKITNLEAFDAGRVIDRILDKGDITALVEKFEEIEEDEARDLEESLSKGVFTLVDFKKQLKMMNKLGGFGSLMGFIPGLSGLKDKLKEVGGVEKTFKKHMAIIDSMTKIERTKPQLLNFSRKKRIASGSGTTLQDINVLLKQFEQTATMLKSFKNNKGALAGMQKQLGGMLGGGVNPTSIANPQDMQKNMQDMLKNISKPNKSLGSFDINKLFKK